MKVAKDKLVKLLTEMGWTVAPTWDLDKLKAKVANLPKYETDADAAPASKDCKDLLKSICKAVKAEQEVEITGADKPAAEEKPAKGKAKAEEKAEPKAESKTEAKAEEKPAKEKKEKAPVEKKVGVIATILECLRGADAENPVTKSKILALCVKRFPERLEAAMKSTIASQIPSGLKAEKKLIVKIVEIKDSKEKGYYLPPVKE